MAARKYASSTRRTFSSTLQALAAYLENNRLIPRTGYQSQQPTTRASSIRHIADRDAREHLLPPNGALLALADAAQTAKDDQDRCRFAIILLITIAGFRMYEALTLPATTLREDENGQPYLAYWPEKGGPLERRVIPSVAISLVRGAVDTLLTIGADARARARELEAMPGRIPLLVVHDPSATLDTAMLAPALGLATTKAVIRALARLDIPPVEIGNGGKNGGYRWRVDDVERGLARKNDINFLALQIPGGKQQLLSQYLCLTPSKFFRHHPSLLIVEAIGHNTIANFLYSGSDNQSVFQRYGLLDESGQPWSIHAHQLRHWIDNLLVQGGLSGLELARWMGRRDVRQNDEYNHVTEKWRIEALKTSIRAGMAGGSVAEIYHGMAPASRERFLDAAVEAAHATPFGMCLKDFATKPCEFHLQCLSGCGDFIRTKGDQQQVKAILQVQTKAQAVLEAAQRATEQGFAYAPNWVQHQRRLLIGADRALAIEDAADIRAGEGVAVFPGTPSLAEPSVRERLRRQEQEED